MAINLKGRSVLKLLDFSPDDIRFLLRLSASLKQAKYGGYEEPRLKGKNIALIFEKDSTRTRTGFEVAAYDQGAHVTYLGPTGTQIGKKESMKDTARVLGRLYDGIEYRGFGQEQAETLAKWAGVPVYNGLTDEFHPTQILADFLTMREYTRKHLSQMAFCFLGDAGNNMGNSLLTGAALIGMDVRLGAPKACWPHPALVVLGSSPVAVALVEQAQPLGFHVTLAAPFAEFNTLPQADDLVDGFGIEASPGVRRFVVVSTQGKGDEAALKAALAIEADYHGFVGSRRKMASLREKLVADGLAAARIDHVKAPAGLDIGAITPEEIALSILSEIILERRHGQRAQLTT